MDLEVAFLPAKGGNAQALIDAMESGGGKAALLSCPGCIAVRCLPGIENPGTVLFLVEWESIEAHAAAKQAPGFGEFIGIVSPFFSPEGGGAVQHFRAG